DAGQAADGGEETGGIEALPAPAVQRRAGGACHRQDPPECCRHQITDLPVRAWTLATEGSQGDLDETWVTPLKVKKVEPHLGEPSRGLSVKQQVGTRCQVFELALSLWRVQVQFHSLFTAVVPPIEKTATLSRRSFHRRTCRAAPDT